MICVLLEDCCGCHLFKTKHPELRYIELPLNEKQDTPQIAAVRANIIRLKLDKFPILLNDGMTKQIDIKNIDPDYNGPETNC